MSARARPQPPSLLHPPQAILHAAAILATATVLEPLWGTPEWARFLAAVGFTASTTALAASYLAYAGSSSPAASLLHTPRAGAAGLVAASLVGVVQAMPDREVTLAQVVKLRMKHVPALYVAGLGATSLLVGRGLATIPLLLGGAGVGWGYLRFLKAHEGGGRYALGRREEEKGGCLQALGGVLTFLSPFFSSGDASAEFRLAAFFPAPVMPVVDAMAGGYDRALQMVARAKSGVMGGADGGGGALAGAGGKDDATAQRRRWVLFLGGCCWVREDEFCVALGTWTSAVCGATTARSCAENAALPHLPAHN